MQAGSSLGGGTVINWQNCLRTFPWVREQWAREHGLEGLDGADFDRCLDQVMERIGVTDSCSELNGPHQRLQGGLRGARLGLQADHPQRRPGEARPGAGRLRRLRRRHRLQAVHPEDLPRRRARAGRRPGRQLPRRADPGGERARGRGGGRLRGPGRRRRPGRGSRAAGGRRLRLDRVARAPAALGDRRARRRRLPAPSPRRRPVRRLRRAAGRLVGSAAVRALPRVRRGGRGARLPARGRPPLDRDRGRRDALAVRPPAQAGAGRGCATARC